MPEGVLVFVGVADVLCGRRTIDLVARVIVFLGLDIIRSSRCVNIRVHFGGLHVADTCRPHPVFGVDAQEGIHFVIYGRLQLL
jgi:hypothetical protein